MSAIIVHEDTIQLMTYVSHENIHGQGTTTTVINCSTGERVWCKSWTQSTNVGGNYDERMSSFSGFLIHSY